jgi:hypothetical protein
MVAAIALPIVAVLCCAALPVVGVLAAGLTVAAVVGVGAGLLALTAAVGIAAVVFRARRRRACEASTVVPRSSAGLGP